MKGVQTCQCADAACAAGHIGDCRLTATERLYRVDMEDTTGTAFCCACADDAWASGLFSDSPAGWWEPDEYENEDECLFAEEP